MDDPIPLPPPPAPPVPSALAWAPLGTFLGLRSNPEGVGYAPAAIGAAYWPWLAGGLVILAAALWARSR